MKKSILKIALISAILTLNGCDKSETVQTVDWYSSHDTERKEMMQKCQNNSGAELGKPNCINAERAESIKQASNTQGLNLPIH